MVGAGGLKGLRPAGGSLLLLHAVHLLQAKRWVATGWGRVSQTTGMYAEIFGSVRKKSLTGIEMEPGVLNKAQGDKEQAPGLQYSLCSLVFHFM